MAKDLGTPNGMPFTTTQVEEYFTCMQESHWAEEDGVYPEYTPEESKAKYEALANVNESRFIHHPVTGNRQKAK